jgi:protein involved in polysaccharide export with SLBB domain
MRQFGGFLVLFIVNHNNMPRLIFACLFVTGWVYAVSVNGQTPDLSAQKTADQQFELAQQVAQKKQLDVESVQRRLDDLTDQKSLWQREIVNARAKASFAREKLNQASAAGTIDSIEKWRVESDNWDARTKAAIVELEKVESDIQDTVQLMQNSLKGNPREDVIIPGESIEVYVTEDETLNSVYQVRRGGYIVMPRVGRVLLAGKSLSEAERAIKDALQVNQIKNATVMVERPSSGGVGNDPVIYLAGEFQHPGAWKVPHELSATMVTTILRSGGLTDSADLTKVRLLRLVSGQAQVEEVNVQAILNGAGLPSDISLQPGDIVVVPACANTVYVTGNVLKPGPLKMLPEEQLTVYSAILRAGGFARFANRDKIYVLRETSNGVKQRIPVSIEQIQDAGGSDLILRGKDIVVVPEKFFSL